MKMESVKGAVHSIETFGSVDGPGIRYVVFLQGCQMRCQFCHNADTWQIREGDTSAAEVLNKALRYRSYWRGGGGITVSGGEPLLQIDFLIELFELAKKKGVHTAIDTCGQPFTREEPFFSKLQRLMDSTDLVLLDLKHIDSVQHRALTGWGNEQILDFARYLSDIGKPVWIRHVLVPSRNDQDEALSRLDGFVKTLSNVERFEVLPYHTLGVYKWKELGLDYPLEGIDPPGQALIDHANAMLHTADYQRFRQKNN